jgi:hypothetical protein
LGRLLHRHGAGIERRANLSEGGSLKCKWSNDYANPASFVRKSQRNILVCAYVISSPSTFVIESHLHLRGRSDKLPNVIALEIKQ